MGENWIPADQDRTEVGACFNGVLCRGQHIACQSQRSGISPQELCFTELEVS
jgi:hypothetical protein